MREEGGEDNKLVMKIGCKFFALCRTCRKYRIISDLAELSPLLRADLFYGYQHRN